MERRGLIAPAAAIEARARASAPRARRPRRSSHRISWSMVLADLPDPKPARIETTLDADLQRTIEGIVRSQRDVLERHGAHERRRRRARQRDGGVAGVGRIRRLLRRGDHGGAINGRHGAATAGLGAQAVHLRAGIRGRAGLRPRVLPDVPSSFPDGRGGRRLQLRATTTDSTAVRCSRGRALAGSRTCRPCALASELGVPGRAAVPAARRLHDVRSAPARTTASA